MTITLMIVLLLGRLTLTNLYINVD
jgi:hypothetical protein